MATPWVNNVHSDIIALKRQYSIVVPINYVGLTARKNVDDHSFTQGVAIGLSYIAISWR
jgi:hypothetical protein